MKAFIGLLANPKFDLGMIVNTRGALDACSGKETGNSKWPRRYELNQYIVPALSPLLTKNVA